MDLKEQFTTTAKVVLDRIESPRIAGWWLDVEDLLQRLEQIRRDMSLPHWLPAASAELSRLASYFGSRPDVPEDKKWKPGNYDPCFFTVCTLWPADVPKWLDVCIGDPFGNPMRPSFIVERREIFLDRDEVEEGEPAESGLLFDDVRKDLQFFLRSWLLYVESVPKRAEKPTSKKPKADRISKEVRKEAERIIDDNPDIKGNDFVGMLGIKRENGLELWRELTKKTKRRTTRESGSRMK